MNLMNLTNLINLFTKNTLLEVTLSNQSALKSQYFLKQVTKVPLKCSFFIFENYLLPDLRRFSLICCTALYSLYTPHSLSCQKIFI